MPEIGWIKIRTDMFDHRKIKQIETLPDGDAIIVIWVKLLCLAGATNNGGLIYLTRDIPYTEEMLANEFRRPLNTVRLALQTFEQFGMIEKLESIYAVSNWEKYQSAEGMDKVREQTRKRVQEYRERQKQLGNVTVTQSNGIDIDTDKDTDKEKNISKRFVPPTLEEVSAYISENGYTVNPSRFIDFYESKGWMVGKSKMKDWKSALRGWQSRENDNRQGGTERGNRFV